MAMGHGSWVMWVMGQMCDGSQKMTHFYLWAGSMAKLQPKSNLVHYSFKTWNRMATTLVIFLNINWSILVQYLHFLFNGDTINFSLLFFFPFPKNLFRSMSITHEWPMAFWGSSCCICSVLELYANAFNTLFACYCRRKSPGASAMRGWWNRRKTITWRARWNVRPPTRKTMHAIAPTYQLTRLVVVIVVVFIVSADPVDSRYFRFNRIIVYLGHDNSSRVIKDFVYKAKTKAKAKKLQAKTQVI